MISLDGFLAERSAAMKRFGFLLFGLLFVILTGCDGDGDGEAAPPEPPPPTPATVTVAEGTVTVPTSTGTTLATFSIAEPGVLVATVTWSGAPGNIVAAFLHEGSTVHGLGNSGSPFISTATVTDAIVVAGHNWEFNMTHSAGSDVDFTYLITFTPD
jgi:hypothetical protein